MADIRAQVVLELDDRTIDISDRVLAVQGHYGRTRGLTEFSAGACTIMVAVDDSFLAPGSPGADVAAADLQGRHIRIAASTEPIADGISRWLLFDGEVSDIRWQQSEVTATATIRAVDDFVRLSSNTLTLTGVPLESTSARVGRLLDEAGFSSTRRAVEAGTLNCISAATLEGRALDLLRRVAATEGGRIAIVHDAETTDEPGRSVMRFLPRGWSPAVAIEVSDIPDATHAAFSRRPRALSDDRLLVTSTRFTDGDGTVHTADDAAASARYGRREIARTTMSSATDTTDLASWWRSTFGIPLERIQDVAVAVHLESDAVAQAAMGVTVGDAVAVTLQRPNAAASTAAYTVDGVTFELSPLDMEHSTCRLDLIWSMFPPEAAAFWVLGLDSLGFTTKLAPDTDVSGDANAPAGWIDWTDGVSVTYRDFTGHIAAQRIGVSADPGAVSTDETAPYPGVFNISASDLTLRVYVDGGGFQPVAVVGDASISTTPADAVSWKGDVVSWRGDLLTWR